MFRLHNPIQRYAWGSRSVIADLLGAPSPAPTPEAELWLGAHPSAPSRVIASDGEHSLLEIIEQDPEEHVGLAVSRQFGPRLPFLLKVLAAAAPLSLQAHPNAEQAGAGYEAEEARGVSRDDPQRNYRDPRHKPELLCALGRFEALCGFGPVPRTLRLLDTLDVRALRPQLDQLRTHPNADGLRKLFAFLLQAPPELRRTLVEGTLDGCARLSTKHGEFAPQCAWALRLGDDYPGDIGILGSLLLNLLVLRPGEAVYLPAGNLHCYLEGTGVEIMANSDNVLRGGLTPKHVDRDELLRIVDFTPAFVTPLSPESLGQGEQVYVTPSAEFRLSRIELESEWRGHTEGPEVLLCTSGTASLTGAAQPPWPLRRGDSVFVSASQGRYALRGNAVLFRATVGSTQL
jgi:mannose-6-phosphate isomerase